MTTTGSTTHGVEVGVEQTPTCDCQLAEVGTVKRVTRGFTIGSQCDLGFIRNRVKRGLPRETLHL